MKNDRVLQEVRVEQVEHLRKCTLGIEARSVSSSSSSIVREANRPSTAPALGFGHCAIAVTNPKIAELDRAFVSTSSSR